MRIGGNTMTKKKALACLVALGMAFGAPSMVPDIFGSSAIAAVYSKVKVKHKKGQSTTSAKAAGSCGTYMYMKGGKCLDARAKK
jgi:hypothetical protein